MQNEIANNFVTNSEATLLVNTWATQFRRIFRQKSWEQIPERYRIIYAIEELDINRDKDPIVRAVDRQLAGVGYNAVDRVQALTLFRIAYITHANHTKPSWWMIFAKHAYNKEARQIKAMEKELLQKGCPRSHINLAKNDTMNIAQVLTEELQQQREEARNLERIAIENEVERNMRRPTTTVNVEIDGELVAKTVSGIKYADYKFNETNKVQDINTFGTNVINGFAAHLDKTTRRLAVQANQNLAIKKTMGKASRNTLVVSDEELKAFDESVEEAYNELYNRYTMKDAAGEDIQVLSDDNIITLAKDFVEIEQKKAEVEAQAKLEDEKEEEVKEAPKKKRGRPRKVSVEKAEDEKDKWTEVSKDDFISEVDEEIKSEVSLEREIEEVEEPKTEADILAEKYMEDIDEEAFKETEPFPELDIDINADVNDTAFEELK